VSKRSIIDFRTDIFSLGVTLYEMLTQKRPFDGDSSQEILRKILIDDPRDPHRVNSRVPRDLGIICLKAMEKRPADRYQSMNELALDLRRYLSGDVILAKPSSTLTKVVKRVKRNPAVSIAVGVAAFILIAAILYLLWSYPQILRQRDSVLRLSASLVLSQLIEKADGLWPAMPDQVPAMAAWLLEADELLDGLELHRRTLKELRRGGREEYVEGSEGPNWRFEDKGAQWHHDQLVKLIGDLEDFASPEKGLRATIIARCDAAKTIVERSIFDHQEAWELTIAEIADEDTSPEYGGLCIEAQVGLVPLGRDPASRLFEFTHLPSGTVPVRDENGELQFEEGCGLVFVLIPDGEFQMGVKLPADPEKGEGDDLEPNEDPFTQDSEGPVHPVDVAPFFLSKYEMTQDQWVRFTSVNPSHYPPGLKAGGKEITLLNPVENVTWVECHSELFRLALRLPTEREWEYAARAGKTTVWWTGNDRRSLAGAVNIPDRYCRNNGGPKNLSYEDWLDDGYTGHAPVNLFEPNPFGLHNVCGNVFELCDDWWNSYSDPKEADNSEVEATIESKATKRIARGGSWLHNALMCRSAARYGRNPTIRGSAFGVRPARSLTLPDE